MIYLGVDTGSNGAAVAILEGVTGDVYIDVIKFGAKAFNRVALFEWYRMREGATAFIEKVVPHPAQGEGGKKRRVGVKSMWTMGRNYEMAVGLAEAAGLYVVEVPPKTWQKGVGVSFEKGLTYSERKGILQKKAQEIFTDRPVTLGTADAFLIAEYARRQLKGGSA